MFSDDTKFAHETHIKETAMDIKRAQEILDRVLKKNQEKQQIVVIPSDTETPHNGVSPKVAAFIDSLSDDKIMANVVRELSNDAIELMDGMDEDI